MSSSKERSLDEEQRLLAMREYLRVRTRPHDPDFESEIVAAAVGKVAPLISQLSNSQGEVIIEAIARQQGVRFEEVRSQVDIQRLERRYLPQGELGFGMLQQELSDQNVDALLFQRLHAAIDAPDRWVAVLNMITTQARAYWSRPHELIHRLAEPPQRRLPFYRHRTDSLSRLERIIDLGAAELAFPGTAFGSRVRRVAHLDLTWELISTLRYDFAPTSSLLSAAKAVLRHWSGPVFLVQASVRGRRASPHLDVALRVDVAGYSPSAGGSGVHFFDNMRVPPSSPLYLTHQTGRNISDFESLGQWETSRGARIPDRRALTGGMAAGRIVYGLISLR